MAQGGRRWSGVEGGRVGRGGGPTWMSGPQSTLSGVVSLWVSERPSVMTSAIRLFWVGGSSWFRVYCRASPVNVPPAIHRRFLMALWGRAPPVSTGAGLGVEGGPQGPQVCGRLGTRHSLLELLDVPDVGVPQTHVLLHLVVAVLHHARVRVAGLELHVPHAPVRRGRRAPSSHPPPPVCPRPAWPADPRDSYAPVGEGYCF